MAAKKSLKGLLEDEIQDLYSAEKQLTKAIPKMAKGSTDPALKKAFKNHLKETHGQVARLEKAAGLLDMKPTGKKCMGMEGVIKEGAEALGEDGEDNVLDIGIIGAGSASNISRWPGILPRLASLPVLALLMSYASSGNRSPKKKTRKRRFARSRPV